MFRAIIMVILHLSTRWLEKTDLPPEASGLSSTLVSSVCEWSFSSGCVGFLAVGGEVTGGGSGRPEITEVT